MRQGNVGDTAVPVDAARQLLDSLVRRYGSVNSVARAVADRHGIDVFTVQRALFRIRRGEHPYVSVETYDRLWVMV